jgi:hypothetical protein
MRFAALSTSYGGWVAMAETDGDGSTELYQRL